MEENTKKKKSFGKIFLTAAVVLVAATMVILPFAIDKAQEAAENTASILSGTVESGTIETALSGAGTLTDEDSVEVTVPNGVEITEYLVEEGQYVTEGTELAKVDKTSVLQLISNLQTNLDYVSEEMVDATDTTSTGKIVAKTGGKVMKIYAGVGDNVRDVMDKYGCLAILSIDGYLAVDIEVSDDVKPGDSLKLEFEDGKSTTGKVETKFSGVATVIVSDAYGAPDQTVKVSTRQDEFLAEGTLYIHKEWRAVGYSGTVKTVSAKIGNKLSTGGVLFTLKDTDENAEYNILADQHREYEEVIDRLFTLYKDGAVKAENEGCVVGIDDTLIEDVAYEGQEYELQFLAYYEKNQKPNIEYLATNTPDGVDDDSTYTGTYYVVVSVDNGMQVIRGGAAAIGSDISQIPGPDTSGCVGDSESVSASVVYCVTSKTEPDPDNPDATITTQVWYTKFPAAGDVLILATNGEKSFWLYSGHDTNFENKKDDSGGGGGGAGGGGTTHYIYINGQEEEFEEYEISPVTLMSVVPQQKVSVTITVDELDILSVSLGQEALVTIDALPGRSFTGEVVEIDSTASNSGGNTKFTAKILLDRQSNMLAGMNASCTIVTKVSEGVMQVPTEALVDEGNKTYIYTGLDEDGETLINPVEVETGASDGITTEIISGLEEGQVYYYAYYDTLAIADQLAQMMPGGGGQPPEGAPDMG